MLYPDRIARVGREILDSEALLLIPGLLMILLGVYLSCFGYMATPNA